MIDSDCSPRSRRAPDPTNRSLRGGIPQMEDGYTATIADFPLEKKLPTNGAFQSEYSNYKAGRHDGAYAKSQGRICLEVI
jgi:hypothetical protein